jgi:hypothetical protein
VERDLVRGRRVPGELTEGSAESLAAWDFRETGVSDGRLKNSSRLVEAETNQPRALDGKTLKVTETR